jgi:hypothetical protein
MKRQTFPWKCKPAYNCKCEIERPEIIVPVRHKEKFLEARKLITSRPDGQKETEYDLS